MGIGVGAKQTEACEMCDHPEAEKLNGLWTCKQCENNLVKEWESKIKQYENKLNWRIEK